jgi:hypothetical protein
MMALLQMMADRIARSGRQRRSSTATVRLEQPEHAAALLADPHLWQLWMPAVGELLQPARPVVAGARFHVRLHLRTGRLGFGNAREGYVVVERAEPGVLIWQLVVAEIVERYALAIRGEEATLEVAAGEDAAVALAALRRETAV